jgi:threonine aldolase
MAACPRHAPAVVCVDSAHIQCDEGGAPELTGGLKLHLVTPPACDGKLTPALLASQCCDDSVHRSQPGAVSIANTTELGTVYSCDEVRALADAAHSAGLLLHLDGARISNAAAALGVPLRAFTTDAGVDVVSFGGTKCGAMAAEAVVVLNPALLRSLPYLRKTAMQLCSKQRFVAAQLIALLEATEGESLPTAELPPATDSDAPPLCVRLAARANDMAARLSAAVSRVPGVALPERGTPGANAIFPTLADGAASALRAAGYKFYDWSSPAPGRHVVRFMTSWDTSEEDVDAFVEALWVATAGDCNRAVKAREGS